MPFDRCLNTPLYLFKVCFRWAQSSTSLKKADFWAILHYILYPNKMTLLNKISVSKDVTIDCMLEFGV